MKRNLIGLLLLLAVAGAFLTPVVVQGKSKTQYASGGLFLWLSDAGTAICVGGTPTAWFPPCDYPGTRESIWRDFVGPVWFEEVTGNAATYFTGTWEIRGNCNLDQNLAGPCWGTFEGAAQGGKWEGTWNGRLDFISFGADLSFVGYGTGGSVEGLHMMLEAAAETGSETAPIPFTARVFKVE